MMSFSKRLLLLGTIALLVVASGGWWTWQLKRPQATHVNQATGNSGQTATSPEDGAASERAAARRAARQAARPHVPGGSAAVAALVGDQKLDDREVLAGLQRLASDAGRPLPERLEALEHVIQLSPVDDPAALRELAAQRVQPTEMRERILAEALNYPPQVQGGLLVALLEQAAGDVRQEILGELQGLCAKDLGDDPAAWRAAVDSLPAQAQ